MNTKAFEISYGFFCESVRTEMSGQITPIGIWGEICQFPAKPPYIMPTLGFHVHLKNPPLNPFKIKVVITWPGQIKPAEFDINIEPRSGQISQNLNFNIGNVMIKEPGEVVATVTIKSDPPVTREFRLRVQTISKK